MQNMKLLHTYIITEYRNTVTQNKVLNLHLPPICKTETTLPRNARRLLAQFRANKSPILRTYVEKILPATHSSPLCPLCWQHTTLHIFSTARVFQHLCFPRVFSRVGGGSQMVYRKVVGFSTLKSGKERSRHQPTIPVFFLFKQCIIWISKIQVIINEVNDCANNKLM